MSSPKLTRVMRLDSLPLGQTYFTPEGYLRDRPILTSTGIFEYKLEDGSVRRELRLPEEVFAPESLKSYKGKPIIISHDAGLITKDNVHEEIVGTILSEGYRSGEDVRAEIIIHDTDEMRSAGMKELSLGYNLDLDETPGEWEGQPYDVIQRNIRINHLALVLEARAGDQARLNIDSREAGRTLKGGKVAMAIPNAKKNPAKTKKTVHTDGVLSPEELAKAIEEYKKRRAEMAAAKADEGETAANPEAEPTTADGEGEAAVAPADEEAGSIEEKVQMVKDRRDRRDAEGDPESVEAAKEVISNQDDDMGALFDIIDTLLAERAFDAAGEGEKTDGEGEPAEPPSSEAAQDGEGCENLDDDDDPIPSTDTGDIKPGEVLNADSVDAIVRARVQLGVVGEILNMDGLESMNLTDAKKAVIKAVRPTMRLDGKSAAFVDAAYEMACGEVRARSVKDTNYQKRQMFNRDSCQAAAQDSTSALSARERMIARQQKKEEK